MEPTATRYLVISEGLEADLDRYVPILATSDPEVIRAALEAVERRVLPDGRSEDLTR
jgi:hypothetical protein